MRNTLRNFGYKYANPPPKRPSQTNKQDPNIIKLPSGTVVVTHSD